MIPSAYIHVPFCSTICSYCAFAKNGRLDRIDAWLDALESEIRQTMSPVLQKHPGFRFETIYIGGGTPSVLDLEQTRRLLSLLSPFADEKTEWTIEANPESVDQDKARMWRQYGVNRVSIGIETFNAKRLAELGRAHTINQSRRVIALLKECGFTRLGADLMYGFPGETLEELNTDIDRFLELDISHLSIYSLILEEGTRLARQISEDDLDEDLTAGMYETIEARLKEAGYEHYEISSYARNADYGRHNALIWDDGQYYGFGWGACGRDDRGLYEHSKTFAQYLSDPMAKTYEEEQNPAFDALMTGFRTKWGVDVQAWNTRYKDDFFARFGAVLKKWNGRFVQKKGRLALNEDGMEVLDSILVDFLMAQE